MYNASSVPVLQLSLKSDRHSEQQLYDYGLYNLRQQLAPVQGDPVKLQARGLTPTDVVNAVNAQNLTLASGLAKIGRTNAMPASITGTSVNGIKNMEAQTLNGTRYRAEFSNES
jgi:multidrug efflux pump subunit AcrB